MVASSEVRQFLAKKLLCRCPVCNKSIYGQTIGIQKFDVSQIKGFPFAVTYVHNHDMPNSMSLEPVAKHALTLFLDANLCVRDYQASALLTIDN